MIQDEASGMPVSRLTLAELLKTTPSSSVFQQLVASSRFYGLTEGGINSAEYKLTEIGQQATGEDADARSAALKQAAVLFEQPLATLDFENLDRDAGRDDERLMRAPRPYSA